MLFALLTSLTTLASSCVNYRDLVNFNEADLPASSPEAIRYAEPLEIQPNDLLRINVYSLDPLAAAPFNIEREGGFQMPMGGGDQLQVLELFHGYFVGEDGYIDFPALGSLEAAGKTIAELKADLRVRLEKYIKEPVVNIRYLNFKVTVLGAVNMPGVLRLTNPRVTVLEALGYAGDLTDYADRSDVLVIREVDGQREYAHLDLQTDDIFESDYFYLEQNDLIYVRPIPARTATVADPAQRIIQYGSGVLSVVALALTIILNNNN